MRVVVVVSAAAAREELPGEVAFAAPRGALPLWLPALEKVDEEEGFERPKNALARGAAPLLPPFVASLAGEFVFAFVFASAAARLPRMPPGERLLPL